MKIRIGKSNSGIALIMVMITVVVLAILAGGFAYSMKVELRLANHANNEEEMEWLGRSGLELAKYVIAQQSKVVNQNGFEALNQKWAGGEGDTNVDSILADVSLTNVTMGNGTISVSIVDLERKFNINVADNVILDQALTAMGVEMEDHSAIIDCILDWRDLDEGTRLSGAESDYYLTLDPPYRSKNGPLDDLSELLLIKGITPEIYWGPHATNHSSYAFQRRGATREQADENVSYPMGFVDLFTTLSSGRLNINTADLSALQAVPGLSPSLAESIIQTRAGFDGVPGNADDNVFRSVSQLMSVPGVSQPMIAAFSRYLDVRSFTFEVTVTVSVGPSRRDYVGIIRRTTPNDFAILKFYWK